MLWTSEQRAATWLLAEAFTNTLSGSFSFKHAFRKNYSLRNSGFGGDGYITGAVDVGQDGNGYTRSHVGSDVQWAVSVFGYFIQEEPGSEGGTIPDEDQGDWTWGTAYTIRSATGGILAYGQVEQGRISAVDFYGDHTHPETWDTGTFATAGSISITSAGVWALQLSNASEPPPATSTTDRTVLTSGSSHPAVGYVRVQRPGLDATVIEVTINGETFSHTFTAASNMLLTAPFHALKAFAVDPDYNGTTGETAVANEARTTAIFSGVIDGAGVAPQGGTLAGYLSSASPTECVATSYAWHTVDLLFDSSNGATAACWYPGATTTTVSGAGKRLTAQYVPTPAADGGPGGSGTPMQVEIVNANSSPWVVGGVARSIGDDNPLVVTSPFSVTITNAYAYTALTVAASGPPYTAGFDLHPAVSGLAEFESRPYTTSVGQSLNLSVRVKETWASANGIADLRRFLWRGPSFDAVTLSLATSWNLAQGSDAIVTDLTAGAQDKWYTGSGNLTLSKTSGIPLEEGPI